MQQESSVWKGGDLVAHTLKRMGIRHVFGIIGAGNVHLFDAITRLGYSEIICVHHEQAACMAVQTYYRTCGRLSCALLTTGAGSTNGVTGVLSAWADSIPCLIIAGNENSRYMRSELALRMWGVQGYDSVQMVERITKYAYRVMNATDIEVEIEKACQIALQGRPGPCWLEIPMDLQSAKLDQSSIKKFSPATEMAAVQAPTLGQLSSVRQAFLAARRPIVWLGHGIRLAKAQDKIPALLEQLNCPAIVSWAGIDMVDSEHPLMFGRAGVYGQRASNFILQNSDYVLAIGTRLAIPQVGYELTELARGARIDVVDIDPHEVMKHPQRITERICCDAGAFIDGLLSQIEGGVVNNHDDWIQACRRYVERFPTIGFEHEDKGGFMNSYRFMKRLNDYFKPNQIVVTDMGTALLSGHQVLNFKAGQRLMTSTGLGEMGYGLPAAIGASFATDRGEVMCLNCDGGMMMNLQELQTIVHHDLPIKLFIFNNDGYLMIKHTQKSLFKSPYAGTDKASGVSCPDFSKLANALGIQAFQIKQWEHCDDVLEQVQSAQGPVICEVFMHPEQPLVPKLSLAMGPDGVLVSPPLEDLSPLLDRQVLTDAMIVGLHPKSAALQVT